MQLNFSNTALSPLRTASRSSDLSASFVAPAMCIGLPDTSLFTWILLQLSPQLGAILHCSNVINTNHAHGPSTCIPCSASIALWPLLQLPLTGLPRSCYCSLNNKALLIYDIILDKKFDFLFLTETWQSQQDFVTLNQATPQDYVYIQKPYSLGRGGGLAVIHRSNIHVKEFPVSSTSFGCLNWTQLSVSIVTQLQVLLIYRPPKASTHILSELSELLATICPMYPSTILLGYFNIHVDSANCPIASDLMSLLDCFGIAQHVLGPTHTKGHTLDLVCSTKITPCHLISGYFWPSCHLILCSCAPTQSAQ